MNPNETLIIVIAVISLPILIYLLIELSGDDKICNGCSKELNPNRHNQYYLQNVNGEKKEVCKSCWGRKILLPEYQSTTTLNAENSSKPIEYQGEAQLSQTKSPNNTNEIEIISAYHKPEEYKHEVENKLKAWSELKNIDLNEIVFLDTETTSLNDPNIIQIAILKIEGQVILNKLVESDAEISSEAQSTHGITVATGSDFIKKHLIASEVYDAIRGKVVVGYNVDFDLKAIRFTFEECLDEKIECKSICLMQVYQEIFRRFKTPSLSEACQDFDIEIIDAHTALGDALLSLRLFKSIKKLSNIDELWMSGFKDISFKEISHPDGTVLSVWTSPDGERDILYSPKSVGGSKKSAELDHSLQSKLERKSVNFIVRYNGETPFIEMECLSMNEFVQNMNLDVLKQISIERNELLNAKIPVKGSLQGKMRLDCREANLKRTGALKRSEYQVQYEEGDILYLPRLVYKEDIDIKKIHFLDQNGESYGTLSNSTIFWRRCFGVIMKGYEAEVHVLSKKSSSVRVFFKKL